MICKTCAEHLESCPVGDYCWCNGYVHQVGGHRCPASYQPTDGWPLAAIAEPDWDALFGTGARSAS